MPMRWRHRIVRVRSDEDSVSQVVRQLVADGWTFLAGERGEAGTTDLVFRRATAPGRAAWS